MWVGLRESGYVSLSAKRTNPQNSYPTVGTFRNVTFYTTDPSLHKKAIVVAAALHSDKKARMRRHERTIWRGEGKLVTLTAL